MASRSAQHNAFAPEQFVLHTHNPTIALDAEVAARLANATYDRFSDISTYPHETPFVVNTTDIGENLWPDETVNGEQADCYQVHIPFPARDDIELDQDPNVINATFAFGLQRLLDAEEKRNRMGFVGTTVMGSMITSVMCGPGIGVAVAAPNLASRAAGAAIALGGAGILREPYKVMFQNIARHFTLNPESRVFNPPHMKATIKQVGKLGLGPVLYTDAFY